MARGSLSLFARTWPAGDLPPWRYRQKLVLFELLRLDIAANDISTLPMWVDEKICMAPAKVDSNDRIHMNSNLTLGMGNDCVDMNGNNTFGRDSHDCSDTNGNSTLGMDNDCMDVNGNNTFGIGNNDCNDTNGNYNTSMGNDDCRQMNGNYTLGMDNDCMDTNGNYTEGMDNSCSIEQDGNTIENMGNVDCMEPNGNDTLGLDNNDCMLHVTANEEMPVDVPIKSWDRVTLQKRWLNSCEETQRQFSAWLKQRYVDKNGKSTLRVDAMLGALSDLEAQASLRFLRDGDATQLCIPVHLACIPHVSSDDELSTQAPKERRKKNTKVRDRNFAAITKVK